jgi:hypothetical protein
VSSGETTPSELGFDPFFLARLDESLLSVSEIGRLVAADDLTADEGWLGSGLGGSLQGQVFQGLGCDGLHARARGGGFWKLGFVHRETVSEDCDLCAV